MTGSALYNRLYPSFLRKRAELTLPPSAVPYLGLKPFVVAGTFEYDGLLYGYVIQQITPWLILLQMRLYKIILIIFLFALSYDMSFEKHTHYNSLRALRAASTLFLEVREKYIIEKYCQFFFLGVVYGVR